MKKFTINSIKMLMIQISAFMLAFSPVVDGYAAQAKAKELNEARVKELLMGLGMTKQQTIGNFFAKNKSKFPPRIQRLLGEMVEKHQNEKMPSVEVASAKGADGKTIPVVRVQAPGHMFNIEVHNNDKYFAKIGPTELNNVDINNFTDAIEKMYRNDYHFRRWVDSQKKTASTKSLGMSMTSSDSVKNEFSLPEINVELWKKLSPEGRAQYILSTRKMWNAAMAVLMKQPGYREKFKSKKTSSMDLMEQLWSLLNENAEAAATPRKATAAATGTSRSAGSDPCLIAGYSVSYKGKSSICNADDIKERYSSQVFADAHKACPESGQIACNPMIYGYPGGKPACVNPLLSDKDFQIATHYEGPCERGNDLGDSRLSTTKIDFVNEDEKSGKRYDEGSRKLSDAKLREEIYKQQKEGEFEQTRKFLEGVLKARNPEMVELFTGNKFDENLIKRLVEIEKDFNSHIQDARKSCITSSKIKRKQENGFWGACDQLQRRELFLTEYLKEKVGCKDGAKFVDGTMKCACPATFGKDKVVFPGEICGGKVEVCRQTKPDGSCADADAGSCGANGQTANGNTCTPAPDQACKNVGFETGKLTEAKPQVVVCSCQGGKVEAPLNDINNNKSLKEKCLPAGAGGGGRTGGRADAAPDDGGSCSSTLQTECQAEVKGKKGDWQVKVNADGAKACRCVRGAEDEEGSSWFKDNKENIIMGGITLAVVLALINSAPKPPSLNPPGDQCTSGQSTCPGECTNVNQVKVNGVCQCRTLPPESTEVLIDAATCTFGPNDGSTTTITCPDNATIITGTTSEPPSINSCPKQTCSDGVTVVYKGQTCPTEVPATKPTSTNANDVNK